MEEVVDTVNQLQEVFTVSGCREINLPQVVMVGTQSAGKSSVLEHLVGRSFLPRGAGVVTRCPLILQLSKGTQAEEYAIFLHDRTRVFTEDHLISKEIEEQTNRLAGNNKAICRSPITLKIFSPHLLNLTLVDLPGMTKVPVGDQPPNIEQETRSLTLEYIENPNSIILAVTPANVDMATSDSLKIAREVDPEGLRTLAVVTKLDLMDEGTDAWDMLSGKVIPVKLGIIGVVNRSQKDLTDGKSIKDSLVDEAAFFRRRYRSVAPFHGSRYLTKTVQKILISHIKKCLPKLKERINQQLALRRSELSSLGEDKYEQPTLLLDLLTKFAHIYCSAIRGNLANIQTNELCGGARINYVFQESLALALRSIDALTGLSKSAILTAMQNASGASPTLFVPEVAFELLVKRQIKRLRSPCLQCVDLIHGELSRIGQSCIEDRDLGLSRFPKLQHEISDVLGDLLLSRVPVTNEMVDHFIDVQLAYINTGHPDFLPSISCNRGTGDRNGICLNKQKSLPSMKVSEEGLPVPLQDPRGVGSSSTSPMDKATRDCLLIQELIQNYFSLVRKSIQDTIPKVIMHFLVNYVVDHLQSELVGRLYCRNPTELLQESPDISAQRKRVSAMIAALEKATKILYTLHPPSLTLEGHRELCSLVRRSNSFTSP